MSAKSLNKHISKQKKTAIEENVLKAASFDELDTYEIVLVNGPMGQSIVKNRHARIRASH